MFMLFAADAVRRNPASNRASEAEMEQVASKWLRFAGDRSGGRERRALQAAKRAQTQAGVSQQL